MIHFKVRTTHKPNDINHKKCQSETGIGWGKGSKDGSLYPLLDHNGEKHFVIAIWTYGKIEIPFQWMATKQPFDSEAKRLELRNRLTRIVGVEIPADALKRRPTIPLAALTNEGAIREFLGVLDWYVGEVRATEGTLAKTS